MKTFYTQGGYAGTKYEETKGLRTQDIAKLVRAELKEIKGFKFSVTSDYNHIRVEVKDIPEGVKIFGKDGSEYYKSGAFKIRSFEWGGEYYSPEISEVTKKIKSILEQYNYDDSDGQIDYFDTRFYKTVCINWDLEKVAKDALINSN